MKTYENDRIEVLTFLHVEVIIKLHDEDGHVEEIDFSIIESVKQENNKTLVRYFTDWEDDPIQGFYVQESVEEVENLLEEANKEYRNAFKNYKIVKI